MPDDGIVLLWGVPQDPPLASAYEALQARGCPVVLFDQRKIAGMRVDLLVKSSADGKTGITGQLLFDGTAHDVASIRSLYQRPLDPTGLPSVRAAGADSPPARHAASVEEGLTAWADLAPILVLNRPAAMFANGSKPFQSAWLASLGFNVPETLITTDSAAVLDFWKEHKEVIYKSISSTRSIVSRLRPEHTERLEHLSACPTQFQQYIPGVEHRAHVVGDDIFACRISSDADDYRYAQTPADMTPCELPTDIAELCKTAAAAMKLSLAGFDLRCTPEGRWYCFEVNPSPGFPFFDVNRNPSIAEAVASLLAAAIPQY